MTGTRPYSGAHYAVPGEPEIELRRLTGADAEALGGALAAIDPWARLGIGPALMSSFLASSDETKHGFTILHGGNPAGAIVVRNPWLAGPYLNMLGLLPRAQGQGVGRAALGWFEAEARAGGARNCFLCASAFNASAIGFYQRNGYSEIAQLEDLIKDGEDEILMRKRLR